LAIPEKKKKKSERNLFTGKTCYGGQGTWQKAVVGVRLVEDLAGKQHCERIAVEERET